MRKAIITICVLMSVMVLAACTGYEGEAIYGTTGESLRGAAGESLRYTGTSSRYSNISRTGSSGSDAGFVNTPSGTYRADLSSIAAELEELREYFGSSVSVGADITFSSSSFTFNVWYSFWGETESEQISGTYTLNGSSLILTSEGYDLEVFYNATTDTITLYGDVFDFGANVLIFRK